MAVHEVPARFKHVCDGCGAEFQSTTRARPNHWSDLTLAQDAYDFQGVAVADGTIRRLLCPTCTTKITAAINAAVSR